MSARLHVVGAPTPAPSPDDVLDAIVARMAADGWEPTADVREADAALVDARGLLAVGTPLAATDAVGSAAERIGDGGSVVVLSDAAVWVPGAVGPFPRPWLAAVHAAVQDAAVRHGPRGVRCNAVVVGGLDGVALLPGGPPAALAGVAGAVAFLCSGAAGFVTGETVAVTGGAVLRR